MPTKIDTTLECLLDGQLSDRKYEVKFIRRKKCLSLMNE